MKLKTSTWAIIGTIATIVPLVAVLIITQLIIDGDVSWWWFWGTFILEFIAWAVIVIIILIKKWKLAQPPKIRIDTKDAIARAIQDIKVDTDNPDNFKIDSCILMKVGESGKPRTPVLWLSGKGTETQDRIDHLTNLDQPKEKSYLRNKTEDHVLEAIRLMAENPESPITETITTGMDMFGRPTATTITKKVSKSEKEEHEEKKKAEELNLM